MKKLSDLSLLGKIAVLVAVMAAATVGGTIYATSQMRYIDSTYGDLLDGYGRAIVLFAALQAIGVIIGNVIYPRMQGRSLNIDPVVVLLSLAVWGAIWGIPGMFLSTPLTVTAIIILAQFPNARWIAVLLSGDGHPEPAAPTGSAPR